MARKQRQFEVMQVQTGVSLGTDDNADLVLTGIVVPEDGAMIREAGILITTAGGASAATFTFAVEERNSTTALSATSATLNSDEPQYTVATVKGPAASPGSGVPATTKGTPVALNLQYSAATAASAAVATVWVIWQM